MMGPYLSVCVLTLSCSVPVEGKPLHADGQVSGHANPTFLLKKQDSDHLVKKPMMSQTARYLFYLYLFIFI